MTKKYGLPAVMGLIVALCLSGMMNGFLEKTIKSCLPTITYMSQGEAESGLEEWVERMVPALSFGQSRKIVIHRRERFMLKHMKPVELITMMSVENIEETENLKEIEKETVEISDMILQNPQEIIREPAETGIPVVVEGVSGSFVPHSLQKIVDVNGLGDLDTLVKRFYTVDTVAKVDGTLLNAEKMNGKDLRITKDSEGPQILIYHTHSQEAFADSVPGDPSTTIVGVGEHLANILRNEYGYNVLHHKGEYDVKTRDNAYSRALPEIQKILEENPTIQVVIDLHRDGLAEGAAKLVMDLDGRPTARFMFFNGVSCGKKNGQITYLHNPNLEDNLAFSFQLKKAAEEYYPGLTRKNYINAYRYNMHLCGRTTLLELGAQNNTLEEAINACDPIAHILDLVLRGV